MNLGRILRRAVGWLIVALGGLAFTTPAHMGNENIRTFSAADLVGFDRLIFVPAWLLVGLVLIFVGFAVMGNPEDEPLEE